MSHLLQALQARAGEFISLRRDIHRHPELAFEEHRTAALVADKLEAWGYAVARGIGGTGVVGTLVRGHSHKRLGIRADMDALPIDEATGLDHASRHPGVMHACGHDGHTAMLLAAARHLAEHGAFDGTLHLIFQPAEEGGGGALRMMEDGLFKRCPCAAIFAMHNMPGIEQGRLVLREGAAMASSDYATITLTGVGGHGAMPHRAADPSVAAASIVMALQTVVSRNIDPLHAAVVTVGAGQVTLQGPPLTGSEDFAFMLERVPGSYVLIGNGNGNGNGTGDSAGERGCMVHNPGYDFNDHNIGVGSAYWVLLAERFLAPREPVSVQ